MGEVRRSAGFATAFAVVLALAACGSSAPKPDPQPRHAESLSADALKAGMLPPSEFGPGLTYDVDSPAALPDGGGDIIAATQTMDCTLLVWGGPREAGIASAYATGSEAKTTRGFFERAGQYRPGDAAVVLNAMADQGRGRCATFTYSLPDTTGTFSDTSTVTAEPGLGDRAYLFEQSDTSSILPGDPPQVSDTLTVEYGDVLVSVGCNGIQADARACDLPAAAKKIAGLLKLK